MAKFDILATIVETRSGEYRVMVSSVPRPAWSGLSELEESCARTRHEGEALCGDLIATLRRKLEARGDEIRDVIGPQWPETPVPARS